MKKFLKEIIYIALAIAIISNVISYIRKPDLISPNLALIDAKQYIGKPMLVHFWATWCPTCKLEAQNIQRVSKDFRVLTVAVQSESDANIKAYMDERNLTFDVLHDKDGSVSKEFKVSVFPTTFIFDSKGNLEFTEVGYTSTVGLYLRMWYVKYFLP